MNIMPLNFYFQKHLHSTHFHCCMQNLKYSFLFLLNAHNFYHLVIFYFIFHQLSWFIFLVNDLTVVSWDIIVYIIIYLIFTYFIVAIQFIFYFFLRRAAVITVIAKDRSWLHRVVLSFFYLLVFFVFFHQYAFFKLL